MRLPFAIPLLGCLIFSSVLPSSAHAFPEMIRHGYVNCTTCHVSPTGGGLLTEYGRQLSREVLSTWGTETEAAFAYRVVKPPEWLSLGGDYRSVYVYRDTPALQDGRYIFMQGDLEAAATIKKLTLAASLGYQNPTGAETLREHLISREHYAMVHLSDELALRAGRFTPAFGIKDPNHVVVTRRALRVNDETFESYNLEGSFIDDANSLYATLIAGRPDDLALRREEGLTLVASRAFAEHYKAGLSYLRGSFNGPARHVFGPFFALGFTPSLYLMSEEDFRLSEAANGFVAYNRLGYEVFKGIHLYASQELGRLDFASARSRVISYGLGAQLFPRPHFEINLTWQKQQNLTAFEDFTDYAYLMFHFYL